MNHLENDDAGAFAHDKAIALRVKWPRGFRRSIVELMDSNDIIISSKGNGSCWPLIVPWSTAPVRGETRTRKAR